MHRLGARSIHYRNCSRELLLLSSSLCLKNIFLFAAAFRPAANFFCVTRFGEACCDVVNRKTYRIFYLFDERRENPFKKCK